MSSVTTSEALTETEQRESVLFQEVNGDSTDLATAMNFHRPVQLELTRVNLSLYSQN